MTGDMPEVPGATKSAAKRAAETAAKKSAAGRTDGRALRSERSRRRIVDALFELVGEGHLIPTAKQVASRAEVGIRTVFRHFDDMDGLYAEVGARLRSETFSDLEVDPPTGDTLLRARTLVELRCRIFDRISPYWRAAEAQRHRSDFLAKQRQLDTSQLRKNLVAWLPELESAPQEISDSIEMIMSPEAWNRLRAEQKLSARRATGAITKAVLALVADSGETRA
jgi:AcrR family transcriptional regulator